jgi:hypothetical protein
MPRRYPIFQFPNAPLITAMLARAVARTTHGRTARAALAISALAQLVWAYQEITDGANGFRRLLGVGAAARAASELAVIAKPGARFRRSAVHQEVLRLAGDDADREEMRVIREQMAELAPRLGA